MKYPRNVFTVILIVIIALWSVPVGAVLTEYTVIGSKGEPVANTEVTIFDEKGAEIGKKKTDDKGLLGVDLQKGKYVFKWQGGEQTVEVPGFWTPTTMAIAGGLSLGAVIGVASSGGGGGGGGSTTPSPPPTPPPSSTVPSGAQVPGTFSLVGEETGDPCNIGYPTISNSGVPFTASNGTVNIQSSATMTGPYNSSTGSFMGSGTSGYFKETCVLIFAIDANGKITATGTLTFEYLSGPNAGCIVTYRVTYTKN